jgi:hypothetical protein
VESVDVWVESDTIPLDAEVDSESIPLETDEIPVDADDIALDADVDSEATLLFVVLMLVDSEASFPTRLDRHVLMLTPSLLYWPVE